MDKEISSALKALKIQLGDSFQAFATRAGISIASAVRYVDGSRQPTPQALSRFLVIAEEHDFSDLRKQFQIAIEKEIGAAAFAVNGVDKARSTLTKAQRGLLDDELHKGLSKTQKAKIFEIANLIQEADKNLRRLDAFAPPVVDDEA